MKVVVWNMGQRVNAWEALAQLDADVALLCEARVPKDLAMSFQGGEATLGRDGYPRPWGAAIVSSHQLRRIDDAHALRRGKPLNLPFETSRAGVWEAAVLTPHDGEDVTVVSLYGLMDER